MNNSIRRTTAALAATAALTVSIIGCTPEGSDAPADPDAPTVMIQVPTMDNSYWADVIKGAEAAAEELGINSDVQVYGQSIDTQLSQIQQAGSKGVDMAMVFAQDQASSPTLIQAATDQGIYVTNVFSNQPWSTPREADYDDHYVGYFLPDNVQDSYNMATSVLDQIGGEGEVLHITGTPGNTTSDERQLGVDRALEEFPGVELVGRESGGESRVDTQPVIEDLLTAHPDVKAVICHNDDSAIAVINALRERGMSEVKVGGIDAIEEFLDDMSAGGNAAATVAIHGAWFGGYNVVRLYDAFEGEKYSASESMMFQDSLTIDTGDAAGEYQSVVYDADPLPFDWSAMSRAVSGDDWDTQVPLLPIEPEDYWGRIDQPAPSGYALPDDLATELADGSVESTGATYLEHAASNPLGSVIALTRAGESSLGQK
ncbi:sugar ABC transporter substrate-binding protein [Microbacterium halophytorum]|uniref:sugar ABC transporter substrate-binding protein n=1 Tax=Microbacterium halophytorum TaxID=2067568 RepID=UPI000CFD7E0B|nr:sugar ABC transporter substrate-binding protein [Microbacterium halophytorum]